jgi:quercetin dioxygenase-like cupin family protein
MDGQVVERRHNIQQLESFLLTCEQAHMPLRHFFAKGLYARELTIPKGCVLTGAIHKTQHISIVLKGHIAVSSEFGKAEHFAGDVLVTEVGTKRAIFAFEDSVFMTVHPTEATTVAQAEADLVTNDFQEIDRLIEAQK